MAVKELEAFRQKYPQYGDMDDATLAGRLAAKYPAYSDLPDRVKSEMQPAQTPKEPSFYEKTMNALVGNRGQDILAAIGAGGIGGPTAAITSQVLPDMVKRPLALLAKGAAGGATMGLTDKIMPSSLDVQGQNVNDAIAQGVGTVGGVLAGPGKAFNVAEQAGTGALMKAGASVPLPAAMKQALSGAISGAGVGAAGAGLGSAIQNEGSPDAGVMKFAALLGGGVGALGGVGQAVTEMKRRIPQFMTQGWRVDVAQNMGKTVDDVVGAAGKQIDDFYQPIDGIKAVKHEDTVRGIVTDLRGKAAQGAAQSIDEQGIGNIFTDVIEEADAVIDMSQPLTLGNIRKLRQAISSNINWKGIQAKKAMGDSLDASQRYLVKTYGKLKDIERDLVPDIDAYEEVHQFYGQAKNAGKAIKKRIKDEVGRPREFGKLASSINAKDSTGFKEIMNDFAELEQQALNVGRSASRTRQVVKDVKKYGTRQAIKKAAVGVGVLTPLGYGVTKALSGRD